MKEIIQTQKAPAAIGPYSQAVKTGGLLFTSGQIPLDPVSGIVVEGGIVPQTKRVMENLKAILEAAGLTFSSIIKTTVYLQNMDDFKVMNEVYGEYFVTQPPARAAVQVSRLPKDVLIEIEVIAAY